VNVRDASSKVAAEKSAEEQTDSKYKEAYRWTAKGVLYDRMLRALFPPRTWKARNPGGVRFTCDDIQPELRLTDAAERRLHHVLQAQQTVNAYKGRLPFISCEQWMPEATDGSYYFVEFPSNTIWRLAGRASLEFIYTAAVVKSATTRRKHFVKEVDKQVRLTTPGTVNAHTDLSIHFPFAPVIPVSGLTGADERICIELCRAMVEELRQGLEPDASKLGRFLARKPELDICTVLEGGHQHGLLLEDMHMVLEALDTQAWEVRAIAATSAITETEAREAEVKQRTVYFKNVSDIWKKFRFARRPLGRRWAFSFGSLGPGGFQHSGATSLGDTLVRRRHSEQPQSPREARRLSRRLFGARAVHEFKARSNECYLERFQVIQLECRICEHDRLVVKDANPVRGTWKCGDLGQVNTGVKCGDPDENMHNWRCGLHSSAHYALELPCVHFALVEQPRMQRRSLIR
jgi:hypothetical protein